MPLGWATITHPFHPRRRQRFEVIKIRQISGVKTLTLRLRSGGTLTVNREWTDHAEPSPYSSLNIDAPILSVHSLLAISELVENIYKKRVDA